MEQHYLILDSDNIIVNIIVWDGVTYDPVASPQGWTPPPDTTWVATDGPRGFFIGDRYDPNSDVSIPVDPS